MGTTRTAILLTALHLVAAATLAGQQTHIFSNDFEAGDMGGWSLANASSWGIPLVAGRRLQGVCVQLGAEVTSPVGKPPLDVHWDVELDGTVDMYSTVVSTAPDDVEQELMVEWTPERVGPTPVGLELVNPFGSARVSFLYDVRDPSMNGACCQASGACLEVVSAAECDVSGGAPHLGLYCSQVACIPTPTPTWQAQCVFGVCAFDAGSAITFLSSNAQGPWRYAWDTPSSSATCSAFGEWGAEQEAHAYPAGEWRPCAQLQDLAGQTQQIRETRTLLVVALPPFFADGFETGDVTQWSSSHP